MANRNFSEVSPQEKDSSNRLKAPVKADRAEFTEKTVGWGGLPGPKQPSDRSAGVFRLKVHPKSEGL